MFTRTLEKFTSPKTTGLAMAGAGVGALLIGKKATAVSLFSGGIVRLEKVYREENAFEGSWRERFQRSIEFYEETHANDTNRWLHTVGIPIIVGSTVGMLVSPRYTLPWFASLGGFTFGWGMNLVGHGFFEKNAPAFTDDPLSFATGPIWDFKNLFLSGGDDESYNDAMAFDGPLS